MTPLPVSRPQFPDLPHPAEITCRTFLAASELVSAAAVVGLTLAVFCAAAEDAPDAFGSNFRRLAAADSSSSSARRRSRSLCDRSDEVSLVRWRSAVVRRVQTGSGEVK